MEPVNHAEHVSKSAISTSYNWSFFAIKEAPTKIAELLKIGFCQVRTFHFIHRVKHVLRATSERCIKEKYTGFTIYL